MKRIKLTREEKKVEAALDRGEYKPGSKAEYDRIAAMITARKKDAVLNLRINSQDLKRLKQKAQNLGVRYQSFISEILHKVAQD